MSQRNSEYARLADDAYYTPEWVTRALIPHLPSYVRRVWEPAAGTKKKIASALRGAGYLVRCTDIKTGQDFLAPRRRRFLTRVTTRSIITNPPYLFAQEFIERALAITEPQAEAVAMLLRVDFDSAKTRRHLFENHNAFVRKVVLLDRVRWIEGSTGSPSENHAWFIWDWNNPKSIATSRLPTIVYESNPEKAKRKPRG